MVDLVVENGSIVTGANTYATIAEYIAYAANRGVTVTDTDAYKIQLIKAADYIGSKENQLKGDTVEKAQPLSFPRNNLTDIDGWSYNNDEIPYRVKETQMSLALDLEAGEDLYNKSQSSAQGIKRERVEGAVEVEYAISNSTRIPYSSRSNALLASLLRFNGLGIPLVMA